MRIASFEVRNYKGVAFAALDDIANQPVVTISGRNGTGKSLILEALVGAWLGRYNMAQRVGPWGPNLSIAMTVQLSDEEWRVVDDWHATYHGGGAAPRDELRYELTVTKAGGSQQTGSQVVHNILRNANFRRETMFSSIDFLPANRLIPPVTSPTVDLGMLSVERVEQERYSMLDNFINSRAPMSLPSVTNYLVTLDYQAFLADRQGLSVDNDYARLAAAFAAATGKSLELPEYDPVRGSDIQIQLPVGHRHALTELSSGEQEMLAMMYFVRRLSAAGGVLCIDEPEQHLHPTLQAALFESMSDLAQRAQVLLVSHSVNLIATAPIAGLVQVVAPTSSADNQATRLTDHPAKLSLVGDLGLSPADLFQSDVLVVVEGDTDAQWLRSMFPVEMGRAHILVAGSRGQVLDAHATLEKTPAGIPWLCVCDRDLLTDEEIAGLRTKHKRLHVWPRRAIESLLLEPTLIAAVGVSVGKEVDASTVERWLVSAAAPLQDEVLETLVRNELSRSIPAPTAATAGDRFDRLEAEYRNYAAVNSARAAAVRDVEARQRAQLTANWPTKWAQLVNPKPLVARVHSELGAFKSSSDLISALVARAREDAALRPPALEEFRKLVAATLSADA